MKLRKAILIGSVASGKTTLRQQLLGQAVDYAKTQSIEVFDSLVDTPGEYVDHGRMRHALQLVAYDVEVVILVHAATRDSTRLPPGIASSYNRETWGVVTHIDVADQLHIRAAEACLRQAGASKVFLINGITGEGVGPIKEALCVTAV